MANYDYYTAKDVLESGEPYSLESVATSWRNFAEALRNASGHLQNTSDQVTAQYGTPYQNFGDRAAPLASWMKSVSSNADAVASGLSNASTTGSQAQTTMYQEDHSFATDVDRIIGPEQALSVGRVNAIQRREAQAATVLNGEIDKWAAAYNAFQPGSIGTAPTRASGGTAAGSGTGAGTAPATSSGRSTGGGAGAALLAGTGGAASGTVGRTAPGGGTGPAGSVAPPGGGDFSHSAVVGPDGGDFAGWVRDPRTGFLIDPATGQEFDPTTGRWIDPVTGKPFGDVVQYASRLEGLNGGVNTTTGLLAGSGGGAPLLTGGGAAGGGGTGLAGMFGGVLPPSLAAGNPAASQLQQRATDSMAAKAYAAQQLAMKEASQGGRPYLPPTQAGLPGLAAGGRRGNRSRLLTEPASTWTNRRGGAGSRSSGGRSSSGGAVAEEPLLSAGGRGGGGGRGAGGLGVADGRGAGGRSAAGRPGGRGVAGGAAEPLEEGAVGPRGRGGGTSGAGGTRAYLPPMQGQAGGQQERRRKRPGWLVEDDVWSADQEAGPAVLGEE